MDMQNMGGLLGGGQQQSALLGGGAAPAQAMPQAGQSQGMQMVMALAQNPTPQAAQEMAKKLQSKGTPEAAQLAQVLMQIADSPEAVKNFANSIMKQLSGGQA